jgi:hypothetical protein
MAESEKGRDEILALFRTLTGTGEMSFNNGLDSSSRVELARDRRSHGPAGLDDVLEDPVDSIFIKDAQIPVSEDIVFQGFELKAGTLRHVLDRNYPEIRKACFGTDRGKLWNLYGDLIIRKLVGECFDARKPHFEPGLGFFFAITFLKLFHFHSAQTGAVYINIRPKTML